MAEISRVKLFGKLNSLGYKALEGATVFCKLRGNPYVELVHWVHQLLQNQDSDLHRIIRRFGLDEARLAADLTAALDRLPRGSTSISDLSAHLEDAAERAWTYTTLMFGESQIRTGHMIVAALKATHLRSILLQISDQFEAVQADELTDHYDQIVKGSPEDSLAAWDGSAIGAAAGQGEGGAMAPAAMGKQEALARFSTDLTARAEKGELDPVVGRDDEIRQIIDILMRRRQNNPILTGEAGVGKTAIVEGFAQRIAAGDVPPPLKNVRLHGLDLGLLQAGASMKGEFENRLRQVIEEVQGSPRPIILFIDEAHTLIGAGGAAGQGDAANLLKPALARGTLRTIAATTWGEYKKYIEKDPALTRRFQVVKVDEPSEDNTLGMLRHIAGTVEAHHGVQVLHEALEAAVRLSHRYIPARQMPDKAVSLLDTACARVAVGLHAVPAEVEDSRRRIEALETELTILQREARVGVEHAQRRRKLDEELVAERERLARLEERWGREKELVQKVLDIGKRLGAAVPEDGPQPDAQPGAAPGGAAQARAAQEPGPRKAAGRPQAKPLSDRERADLLAELKGLQAQLAQLQGDTPLIAPWVDGQTVASVVADWTGIPVGRMVKDEISAVVFLADTLQKRVLGQRHALETIAKRIKTSRAGLVDPNRPTGVFLLVGPSGVGKTETGLALAETLFGGEQSLITINMSEFQEAHTVSTLKGAPPGYVGYGEGGVLTEAVRRRPYSVVLLDEVEKAHPDVHEIFLQVFDKGYMEDSEGRSIDFRNTVILLTSNVGTDLVGGMCRDPALLPDPESLAKALRQPLLKAFPAALLGRLVVVPYYPVSEAVLRDIARLQLGRIASRLAASHGIAFSYDEATVDLVASRCTELESGARMVDAVLTHTVLPHISTEFLTRLMGGQTVSRVHVGTETGDFVYTVE